MSIFHVDVVSAEAGVYSGEATFVVLPGETGELGVLPGHTPLISRIRPGIMRITKVEGEEESVFIAGGIVEVQPNGVTVLSDTAIRAADLDEAKARQAQQAAQEALSNAKDKADIATIEAELAMLAVQIREAARLAQHSKRS